MGDPRGFLTVRRAVPGDPRRNPVERVRDYHEVIRLLPLPGVQEQARRCMQCGVPFCHRGCPLGNLIPEWNELVYQGRLQDAIERLHATNNFPEFTGFTCPAPCEPACTLEINDDPVMIKHVELSIIENAFREGWVVPRPPAHRTGQSVAVVGSGPAGLAAAAQLNYAGHRAVVYERDEGIGGLLRFGIPDFKLEKQVIDRRVKILEAEGVEFVTNAHVGVSISVKQLLLEHDALVLAVGARLHRELEVPGAKLEGVHLAMEYLYDRNRAIARSEGPSADRHERSISAKGKDVVVIGGGDTAADCIANAHREGAKSITQLDRYPAPRGSRPREIVGWPNAPRREVSSYALEEGGQRLWEATTLELTGSAGRVSGVRIARVPGGAGQPEPGSERLLEADLVLVAIGFTRPERDACLTQAAVQEDERGNVRADHYATSRPRVFACGDARRGASLVVWAINEGRECAAVVNTYLAAQR
ncbi:MAG TPA: glutamate synthase subunit beta [Polyangiaceae bacterium]|nr:glutamate synthase subunit beta [Polyangiaceae bacterium]